MSNADINLCFRVIDLEDVKYKGFKEDNKFCLAEQVWHSKAEWSACSPPCWDSR